MKILLAIPDRDLLDSLKALFETEGDQVSAVFDGPQAINASREFKPDYAVIDETLPRAKIDDIISMAEKGSASVILLTRRKADHRRLCSKILPHAFLAYPFEPAELFDLMERIRSVRESDDAVNNLVDRRNMVLCKDERITESEAAVLTDIRREDRTVGSSGFSEILSLRKKLKRAGSPYGIKRVKNKGYRLVTDNE